MLTPLPPARTADEGGVHPLGAISEALTLALVEFLHPDADRGEFRAYVAGDPAKADLEESDECRPK